MSHRALYLSGIVLLLAILSTFADNRERAEASVATPDGKKCATCVVYGPGEILRCDIPNGRK